MKVYHKTNNEVTMLITIFTLSSVNAATAVFSVKVVDADSLKPIPNVDVRGCFENDNGWKAWTEAAPEYNDDKVTDQNGECLLHGETNNGEVGFHIRKPPIGYYPNRGVNFQFKGKPIIPLMRWRPTDLVITASLCRVECPIPLFVKQVVVLPGQLAISNSGDRFAYDLVKGECLPPFGKGEVADVEFTVLPQEFLGEGKNVFHRKARYKNTVKMSFVGDTANGVIALHPKGDAYLKIRTAPLRGYVNDFFFSEWYAYDLEKKEGRDANRCFAFRIRVKRNQKGEIESAIYGKVYRDIRLLYHGDDHAPDRWSRKVDGVSFLYYLNPKLNDRNLEWDMTNNLCSNPGNVKMKVNHNAILLP